MDHFPRDPPFVDDFPGEFMRHSPSVADIAEGRTIAWKQDIETSGTRQEGICIYEIYVYIYICIHTYIYIYIYIYTCMSRDLK